jgi:hydroxyethylthiazole kinase-like uncharacterized protein yjeF
VLTPESVQPVVATAEPCLMTVPLPETRDGQVSPKAPDVIKKMACEWAEAIAIGPGLGPAQEDNGVWVVVERILAEAPPVVVDADALNAAPEMLHASLARRQPRPSVITPHPGEMARLRRGASLPEISGNDDETRLRIAHEYARLTGAVVVLKGYRTVVCTSDQARVNTTGNPGMATGGMGDVLTGLIAALLGQGLSAYDAARLGVYVHGLAADRCEKKIAPLGYVAREVADAVPAALAEAARPPIGFK